MLPATPERHEDSVLIPGLVKLLKDISAISENAVGEAKVKVETWSKVPIIYTEQGEASVSFALLGFLLALYHKCICSSFTWSAKAESYCITRICFSPKTRISSKPHNCMSLYSITCVRTVSFPLLRTLSVLHALSVILSVTEHTNDNITKYRVLKAVRLLRVPLKATN